MPRDELNDDLMLSIRNLSMQIDTAALELNHACECGLFDELMTLSERLSVMADAMEDPSLVDDILPCRAQLRDDDSRLH